MEEDPKDPAKHALSGTDASSYKHMETQGSKRNDNSAMMDDGGFVTDDDDLPDEEWGAHEGEKNGKTLCAGILSSASC